MAAPRKRVCPGCGRELPIGYEEPYCRECREKQARKKKVLLATGLTVAGVAAVATATYLIIKNEDKIREFASASMKKVPFPTKASLSQAGQNLLLDGKAVLTSLELAKLKEAVKNGTLAPGVLSHASIGVKDGQIQTEGVLEQIRSLPIVENLPQWASKLKSVSKEKLDQILKTAAAETKGIVGVDVFDNTVRVVSRSGKDLVDTLVRLKDSAGDWTAQFLNKARSHDLPQVREFAENAITLIKNEILE